MIKVKIYPILISIFFSTLSFAGGDLKDPDITKYMIQDHSALTDYKNTKDKITYSYMKVKDGDFWFVGCSRALIKGLPTVDCLILSNDNHLAMHLDPEGTMVLFDREGFLKTKQYLSEVNYRIDGRPMQTSPKTIFDPSSKTNSFVSSLILANRIDYSIKGENGKYETYQYDLKGLDRAYGIAKEIIKLNN